MKNNRIDTDYLDNLSKRLGKISNWIDKSSVRKTLKYSIYEEIRNIQYSLRCLEGVIRKKEYKPKGKIFYANGGEHMGQYMSFDNPYKLYKCFDYFTDWKRATKDGYVDVDISEVMEVV